MFDRTLGEPGDGKGADAREGPRGEEVAAAVEGKDTDAEESLATLVVVVEIMTDDGRLRTLIPSVESLALRLLVILAAVPALSREGGELKKSNEG